MIYRFTAEAAHLRKKQNAIFGFFILFYFFVSLAFRYVSVVGMVLPPVLPPVQSFLKPAIFLVIFVVVLIYGLKRVVDYLRSCQLEIDSTGLVFIQKNKNFKVSFSSITRMIVYENPLKIYLKAAKSWYVIYGFENMEEILLNLEKNVEPDLVRKKTRLFDDGKTSTLILLSLIAGFLFSLIPVIVRELHSFAMFLMPLLVVAVGIRFVFFTPINMRRESPKNSGWVFIGLGLLLLFCSFVKLGVVFDSVGEDYEYGTHGKTVSYSEAMKYFLISDRLGYVGAQVDIGYLYEMGYGVPQDYQAAMKWFQMAADKDNASGQNNLGWLYQNGFGVPQDYAKALDLYQKAVSKNDGGAQEGMGELYEHGWGVEKDYLKAMEWYEKAADQGIDVAMYRMGLFYKNGVGVTQNPIAAKEWFVKAVALNNADAKKELGQ